MFYYLSKTNYPFIHDQTYTLRGCDLSNYEPLGTTTVTEGLRLGIFSVAIRSTLPS
jgi:hypothetical protein